jgi:hypothetical protein
MAALPLADFLLNIAGEFRWGISNHIKPQLQALRLHVRQLRGFDDLRIEQADDVLWRTSRNEYALDGLVILGLRSRILALLASMKSNLIMVDL